MAPLRCFCLVASLFATVPVAGDLVVTEFMYKVPAGVGSSFGHGYVAIKNVSGGSLDLAGYSIDDRIDGGGAPYVFGSSLVVPADGFLILGRLPLARFEEGTASPTVNGWNSLIGFDGMPSNATYLDTVTNISGGTFLPELSTTEGDGVNLFDPEMNMLHAIDYTPGPTEIGDGAFGNGFALSVDLSGAIAGEILPFSSLTAVPEPSAFLFGGLVAGLAVLRRRG